MRDSVPEHLRSAMIERSQAPRFEDERGLPSLRDDDQRCFSRPMQRPVFALHFIAPKGTVRSFQYMHLDSDSRYEPGRITLRFAGADAVAITIEGRNLWELYDYIHQHRVSWIRQAMRDFARDQAPIVTKVSIVELTPDGDD